MCDYCGCRDTAAAIGELSDEHEEVLELTYRLRRLAGVGDHPGVAEVLETLEPLLARHTAKEEQGLFTQLRAAWGADDRLDALVDEHRMVDALLDVVRAGDPGWRTAARTASDTLSAHLLAEETDLFPYAMYELRPEQWAAIDEIHARLAARDQAVASAPTNRARV